VLQIVRAAPIAAMPLPLVPNDSVIRALVAVDLYQDALNEVQYAQRVWGDSPALQATVAWIRHERALEETSNDRFTDLRGAITIMRRAYPQFLAAGGENLPPDILRVIFPLDYWPIIKKYARKVGVRYSAAVLTQPETNVRLGMTYFKDLVDRFGGAHFALASYNAGEQRIARWRAESPGLAQDEFIDDIPFPETQNYVKRILGTAEDYRRLYGGGILLPGLSTPPPAPRAAPAKKAPVRKAPARPARPRR
jgi:soluble lytic murein transglycosylase-like protein